MKKISSQSAISTDVTLEIVAGYVCISNNGLADGKKTRFGIQRHNAISLH